MYVLGTRQMAQLNRDNLSDSISFVKFPKAQLNRAHLSDISFVKFPKHN